MIGMSFDYLVENSEQFKEWFKREPIKCFTLVQMIKLKLIDLHDELKQKVIKLE